jgi:hypothetical protein
MRCAIRRIRENVGSEDSRDDHGHDARKEPRNETDCGLVGTDRNDGRTVGSPADSAKEATEEQARLSFRYTVRMNRRMSSEFIVKVTRRAACQVNRPGYTSRKRWVVTRERCH